MTDLVATLKLGECQWELRAETRGKTATLVPLRDWYGMCHITGDGLADYPGDERFDVNTLTFNWRRGASPLEDDRRVLEDWAREHYVWVDTDKP